LPAQAGKLAKLAVWEVAFAPGIDGTLAIRERALPLMRTGLKQKPLPCSTEYREIFFTPYWSDTNESTARFIQASSAK
jgi:hypothetical protein